MKSNNTGKLIVRLFVISLILVGADLVAPAQNANSSPTTQEDTSAQNTNTSGTNMNSSGRRRRGRRRSAPTTTAGEETPEPTSVFVTERPVMMPATGRCDPMAQEQTDLSGTYTGRVGYTDVVMAGDATLTINGAEFTLTNDQMTATGRIVAVTTCNYTAVTMRFGKDVTTTPPGETPPPPPPTVSLSARRAGGGLILETVPGESRMFSFHSTGARGGGKSEFRGGMKKGGPPPVGIKPPTE